MDIIPSFKIMVSDVVLGRVLSDFAAHCPDTGAWQFVGAGETHNLRIDSLDSPVRLGALLDWVMARAKDRADQLPDQISLRSGVWSPNESSYTPASTQSPVALRGRENDLLRYLYRAPEQKLSRNDILDKVWGYAPGLETHTLETHIYRLRQKIEGDPSVPRILVTIPNGYQLITTP